METRHASTAKKGLGTALREIEDEINHLREEEEQATSNAERISAERTRKDRLMKASCDLIERSLGGYAPQGYSNEGKVKEIATFIVRKKGIEDPENIKRVVGNLRQQANRFIQMKGLSDLDRVFLALRRGSLR